MHVNISKQISAAREKSLKVLVFLILVPTTATRAIRCAFATAIGDLARLVMIFLGPNIELYLVTVTNVTSVSVTRALLYSVMFNNIYVKDLWFADLMLWKIIKIFVKIKSIILDFILDVRFLPCISHTLLLANQRSCRRVSLVKSHCGPWCHVYYYVMLCEECLCSVPSTTADASVKCLLC